MIIEKKKALITGANSKIAEKIIEHFKQRFVFIKHTKTKKNNFLHGNLSDEKTVKNLFDNIANLDLLICCAGGVKGISTKPDPNDCLFINYDESIELFKNNFFSTFLTCKYAYKKMNKNSNIIIIGSAIVSNPRKNGELGIYASAKSAVHEYSLHLANQIGKDIKVNCLATDGHEILKILNAIQTILENNSNGQIIRLEKF